jgi:hypothetical protein
MILMPAKVFGEYNYEHPPKKIFVTKRSPKKKIPDGWHFETMDKEKQHVILEYIESQGFVMGKTEIKEVPADYKKLENERWITREKGSSKRFVEVAIEPGLSNNHEQRDLLNALYFIKLEQAVPKWPWAWRRTGAEMLL